MKKFKDIQVGDTVAVLNVEEASITNIKVEEVQKENSYISFRIGNLIGLGGKGDFTGRVFDREKGRSLTDYRVFASSIKKIKNL